MRASRVSKLVACILGFLALSGVLGAQQQSSSPCQSPTVMVDRNEDLQLAVDRTPEGAVLQLPANSTYRVSLRITKSLTLCGGGLTVLSGPLTRLDLFQGTPAVLIDGDQPIQVVLYNLAIVGTRSAQQTLALPWDSAGLVVTGQAQVQLRNVMVLGTAFGMLITDSPVVYISSSRIVGQDIITSQETRGAGIIISQSAQVTIEDSEISWNAREGIRVNTSPRPIGPLQLTVRRSQIYANRWGIFISASSLSPSPPALDPIVVFIEDSNISLNLQDGVEIVPGTDSFAQPIRVGVTISNSRVFSNGSNGVSAYSIDDLSQVSVELRGVTIESNGANPSDCWDPNVPDSRRLFCNGVFVMGRQGTRVTIADSVVRSNASWGVGVNLRKCNPYYSDESFLGQVILEGQNVFEGNNAAGHQQGEVCLP